MTSLRPVGLVDDGLGKGHHVWLYGLYHDGLPGIAMPRFDAIQLSLEQIQFASVLGRALWVLCFYRDASIESVGRFFFPSGHGATHGHTVEQYNLATLGRSTLFRLHSKSCLSHTVRDWWK